MIVDKIKKQMELKGISKKELAQRSGVNYNNLRLFLTNQTKNPRINTIERIVKGLGLTLQELLAKEDMTVESIERKMIEKELENLSYKELNLVFNFVKMVRK